MPIGVSSFYSLCCGEACVCVPITHSPQAYPHTHMLCLFAGTASCCVDQASTKLGVVLLPWSQALRLQSCSTSSSWLGNICICMLGFLSSLHIEQKTINIQINVTEILQINRVWWKFFGSEIICKVWGCSPVVNAYLSCTRLWVLSLVSWSWAREIIDFWNKYL